MQESDVIACRSLADTARSKSHAIGRQPFHSLGQVVDPQADVVQRRGVHSGLLLDVERLHDVHLDLEGALPHGQDVLIDVLALALERAGLLQAQHVHPQLLHAALVGTADGDLLDAQHFKGAGHWMLLI
ncbi:hypothetical protein SDC9_202275 [bioreactor metagenome]|uniref:Uncharacterized protein n=1 Tax=bioreactor metagenome TaxID=1076179 RepID=A0A645J282_9ZZZZ